MTPEPERVAPASTVTGPEPVAEPAALATFSVSAADGRSAAVGVAARKDKRSAAADAERRAGVGLADLPADGQRAARRGSDAQIAAQPDGHGDGVIAAAVADRRRAGRVGQRQRAAVGRSDDVAAGCRGAEAEAAYAVVAVQVDRGRAAGQGRAEDGRVLVVSAGLGVSAGGAAAGNVARPVLRVAPCPAAVDRPSPIDRLSVRLPTGSLLLAVNKQSVVNTCPYAGGDSSTTAATATPKNRRAEDRETES